MLKIGCGFVWNSTVSLASSRLLLLNSTVWRFFKHSINSSDLLNNRPGFNAFTSSSCSCIFSKASTARSYSLSTWVAKNGMSVSHTVVVSGRYCKMASRSSMKARSCMLGSRTICFSCSMESWSAMLKLRMLSTSSPKNSIR